MLSPLRPHTLMASNVLQMVATVVVKGEGGGIHRGRSRSPRCHRNGHVHPRGTFNTTI